MIRADEGQKDAFIDNKIIAFIDIGTNSLRLLLVRINPNSSFTILSDQKEVVRLGEGEFVDQYLHAEAMQRATLVSQKFASMARSYRAEEINAVATSATREAANQDEFLRLLKREARLDVRVVSGLEEARLIYLGVSSGVHMGDEQGIFIDIGGGSTEVIVGDQTQYTYLDSLKLGAIRLSSLFFLPDESDPVPPARYALIQQYVRNATIRTAQRVSQLPFSGAYGSSGTIENLADIAAQHFFNRKRERDDTFTHEQISQVASLLCSLPLEERRDVPGINPGRADIIVGGAAILDTLMEDLEIPVLHVSDRGLRDGLLVDYLARHDQTGLLEETSVRRRSILQLARACGVDEAHAQNVARLSLELFDSAREIKLHNLGSSERELLEYSALIHDVGSFLSYSNHQLHSYYLIRNADLLGFDQKEIIIMANAGRHHRKALPKKKKHPEFAALDKRSQNTVRTFAILLRLAESMDRSHTGAISHASFLNGEGHNVILSIQADHDPQLELWGVQNHRANFEKVFKRKLIVETEIENGHEGQSCSYFESIEHDSINKGVIMSESPKFPPQDKIDLYDQLIATNPDIERKGKTNPYTSHNGHMFSHLSKTGTLGLRLPKEEREAFLEKYNTTLYESYGAIMREYVTVPDNLLQNTEELKPYLDISYEYIKTLEPKPSKKKK